MPAAKVPAHPVSSATAPFRAGPVVSATLSLTLRAAAPLLALVALTQGPWAVLEASGVLRGAEDADYYRWSGLYELVFGVLQSGAIVWLIDGASRGERRGVVECLRRAGHRYFSLLGASLQSALLTLLYLLLLVVPGVLKALSYSVVLPVVMLEGKGASASLTRSTQLMDGHRAAVFLATCVVLPFAAGPAIATLVWPALESSASVRAASGLLGSVLGLPFEVLGVVLYAEGVRAHTAFREEVFASTD